MRRDSINTNSAYLEVGFLAQKELPQQDLDPFLKSLLAQNFRARTSEQYTAAALEHLRRWKSCCDLWNSVDLSDLDFAEQHKLRTEFFFVGTTRPFRSHAERRTWSEDFIKGWIRSNGKPADPATIAQQYLRRQQDWFDKPRQLTTEEVLGLLDASPLVEPWNFNTEEHGGVTFTDLSSLKQDAILKCPSSLMNVVRRFVPWELRGGKLYRPTASGRTIGCHKLIVPFLYQGKGVVLPSWDVKISTCDGDWLNWSGDNLFVNCVDGAGAQSSHEFGGESRNTQKQWKRTLNAGERDGWLTADPMLARSKKPKGAKPDESEPDIKALYIRGDYRGPSGEANYTKGEKQHAIF